MRDFLFGSSQRLNLIAYFLAAVVSAILAEESAGAAVILVESVVDATVVVTAVVSVLVVSVLSAGLLLPAVIAIPAATANTKNTFFIFFCLIVFG